MLVWRLGRSYPLDPLVIWKDPPCFMGKLTIYNYDHFLCRYVKLASGYDIPNMIGKYMDHS